ncbi:zinc ribbon domain-containing protein [Natronomonas sp. F2-12]|uniref:Zinc ribbon domain-containing protein n=1 Tax=Natronomonas aquatica TaxID=2841590 RepID=A0A9R1D6R2_9EURY|nr:zinc ribbon domain-containing protein [Natronomonas aquatica]MCQ4332350.1 zinc ribbon domain-containing protein [Natronomonas aquatica]
MTAEEDVNGIAWWIGWNFWITIIGITLIVATIGFMVVDQAGQIGIITFFGLLAGFGIYFWGTRVVNANYEELLNRFVSQAERSAARGIDVAEAGTYSLTRGNGKSPPFVKPSRTYRTTTLVVTGTSVNINQGAKYNMASREAGSGGTNRELFYDQITAVDSHQDGNYSTLEIRTAGGESIEVGSGATETVDAAISAVRKRLRDVKSGRNMSMGQRTTQQQPQDGSSTEGQSTAGTEASTGTRSSGSDSEGGTAGAESEPEPKRECLSCGDRIAPDVDFCPSCGAGSPFEPGTETQSAETGESSDTEEERDSSPPVVAEAAGSVERRTEFDSSTARKLCRVLTDESADEDEVRSAISEAVERLETGAAVSEAVKPADRRSTVEVYENIKRDLDRQQGRLPSAIEPLVDRLIRTNRKLEQQEDDREAVIGEAETVCEAAARSGSVSFESRDAEGRLSELATALQREDVVVTEPSTPIESIAETIDRQARPSSGLSRELIDGLRSPDDESELEATIRESVEVLDEYAETREMLSEIGPDDVQRRLDSLDRELTTQDTPVYSHLADRVRELEALLNDPESIDDIQLYAIYQEISYYDRTLIPRLSRSLSGGESDDVDELLSTVRGRIEDIRSEFVSVRPDHNHSIPKHFLALAEELSADAEQELTTRPQRAAGVLLAADAVLDHVEELYERNEYSVMLRRLRG